jgi:chorismate synthase
MIEKLKLVKKEKDSIGGIVEFFIENVPVGLGDPIYDKLNAKLSYALMSIPASKGFEIGDGFFSAKKLGSERNDLFDVKDNKIVIKTNNEGGVIAGISNGKAVVGRVVFKPTPTIGKSQKSVDLKRKKRILKIPLNNRNDICVAIRAVPVVEAMCALTLVDSYLLDKTIKL